MVSPLQLQCIPDNLNIDAFITCLIVFFDITVLELESPLEESPTSHEAISTNGIEKATNVLPLAIEQVKLETAIEAASAVPTKSAEGIFNISQYDIHYEANKLCFTQCVLLNHACAFFMTKVEEDDSNLVSPETRDTIEAHEDILKERYSIIAKMKLQHQIQQENPFRPEGELSQEADVIVDAIQSGRRINHQPNSADMIGMPR